LKRNLRQRKTKTGAREATVTKPKVCGGCGEPIKMRGKWSHRYCAPCDLARMRYLNNALNDFAHWDEPDDPPIDPRVPEDQVPDWGEVLRRS